MSNVRQVLQDQNTTKSCDVWALGCILFSLLCGRTPFQSASEYLTFQAILHHCDGSEPLTYPETVPPLAQDLIGALLKAVPSERLGAGDGDENNYAALKNHPFFVVKTLSISFLFRRVHHISITIFL
jgi:3-phosphoinositide dependent protein kinase-1